MNKDIFTYNLGLDKSDILYISVDQLLTRSSDKFSGDTLLSSQETVFKIRDQIHHWIDCSLKLFARHHTEDGSDHPDQIFMMENNEVLKPAGTNLWILDVLTSDIYTGLIWLDYCYW